MADPGDGGRGFKGLLLEEPQLGVHPCRKKHWKVSGKLHLAGTVDKRQQESLSSHIKGWATEENK